MYLGKRKIRKSVGKIRICRIMWTPTQYNFKGIYQGKNGGT